MKLSLLKPLLTYSSVLLIASGCSIATIEKPYQPPEGAPTATLTYDINPTSFSDPYNGSEKGFSERIDIYIKDSLSPKSHTISMQFKDRVLKEINKLPANQPITLIYNHLSLRDLFDDWPIWCENSINVTLKPNEEYILKAETEFEPTETKLLFGKKKVPSLFASCSLHLIDKKTGKIITEQFTLPIEKRKPIGMY